MTIQVPITSPEPTPDPVEALKQEVARLEIEKRAYLTQIAKLEEQTAALDHENMLFAQAKADSQFHLTCDHCGQQSWFDGSITKLYVSDRPLAEVHEEDCKDTQR
jgi:hypothetical protein